MKIVTSTILIGLALNFFVAFGEQTSGASPYLKALKYGVSFFTVFDSRSIKSDNLSIIPDNMKSLIAHAENISKKKMLGEIAVRLLYISINSQENGSNKKNMRGVFLGIETEDAKGKIKREMYKFDMEEEEFIKTSIESMSR